MVLCTIIYNASSGDDGNGGTNAPTTALTNTTESETISTATSTTHTFSGMVDLTGVADDGTDVIWIDTPTGERKLFRITSFTDGVSTCTAVVTAEAAIGTDSALAWGIGGKRQTMEVDTGLPDLEDGVGGWKFELEDGTYTMTATRIVPGTATAADGPVMLHAASGASPTLTCNYNDRMLAPSNSFELRGITLTNTGTLSSSRCLYVIGSGGVVRAIDCTFNAYNPIYLSAAQVQLVGCDVSTIGSGGIGIQAIGRSRILIAGCVIHDCTGIGVNMPTDISRQSYIVINNVIYDCGEEGVAFNVANDDIQLLISGNTIHGCGTAGTHSGIYLYGTYDIATDAPHGVFNNILTDNTGYGLECATTGADAAAFVDYNAYRGNTSGEVNANVTKGPNSVTLTADPYTDESGDDYTLNATAGGGAACKDAGLGYNG